MRISAKGRYALAASVYLAQCFSSGEYITVVHISEKLDISKIYLEQVFSLLKRGEIVISVKGAQGGYRLSKKPEEIAVVDILGAIETALFETTKETVHKKAPMIDRALKTSIFNPLDSTIREFLGSISLQDLVLNVESQTNPDGYMFYI